MTRMPGRGSSITTRGRSTRRWPQWWQSARTPCRCSGRFRMRRGASEDATRSPDPTARRTGSASTPSTWSFTLARSSRISRPGRRDRRHSRGERTAAPPECPPPVLARSIRRICAGEARARNELRPQGALPEDVAHEEGAEGVDVLRGLDRLAHGLYEVGQRVEVLAHQADDEVVVVDVEAMARQADIVR